MVKRFIALVLIVLMSVSIVACSGKTKSTSQDNSNKTVATGEPSWKSDNSPFTINWYVDLPWWKWNGEKWGLDLTSKIIKEKTGVTINFIVPASDSGEQLSTMIASNKLPDVITTNGWWDSKSRKLSNQLATEGYIWSMNDLIDKYAPTMKNVIREDVFKWYAENDGKTYVLPNYAYGKKDLAAGEKLMPNGAIVIRKDIWQKIGSPDMSTPEKFLAACEKVKNQVKTYDGQSIIPIQMYEGIGNSVLWLSQYFATPYEDKNGNYLYDFTQPNYKDSLKFLNTAYSEKLISDANFSDTRDLINEKIASGRAFALFVAPQDFIPQFQSLYDKDKNAVYMPIVLRNYKGEDPVLQDIRGFGWLTTSITKNAKQPDRIIKLFEYLLSDEGQIDCAYGKEGETFNYVGSGNDKKIKLTDTYLAAVAKNDTKKYALGQFMMLDNWALRRKWDIPADDPKSVATSEKTLKTGLEKYSYDYSASSLKIDPTDSRFDEMNEISVKIAELRKRAIAEIITAKTPAQFEQRYNSDVTQLKALGLDKLVQFDNDGFKNAKKALGITYSWPNLK